jgi:hypothetical protein
MRYVLYTTLAASVLLSAGCASPAATNGFVPTAATRPPNGGAMALPGAAAHSAKGGAMALPGSAVRSVQGAARTLGG